MARKTVRMILSENGYKNFKAAMKRMGFSSEDLFLRYSVLNTIKPKVSKAQKKEVIKEIRRIKAAKSRRI